MYKGSVEEQAYLTVLRLFFFIQLNKSASDSPPGLSLLPTAKPLCTLSIDSEYASVARSVDPLYL